MAAHDIRTVARGYAVQASLDLLARLAVVLYLAWRPITVMAWQSCQGPIEASTSPLFEVDEAGKILSALTWKSPVFHQASS